MEEKGQYIDLNGLTNGTIMEIAKFQEGLEEIGKDISIDVIYAYVERNEKLAGVSEQIYDKLDVLKGYEAQAILNELPIIKRQAAHSGVKLPEIIEKVQKTGKLDKVKLLMNFSPQVLEKIPNLKVFTPFIWLSEKEIERLTQSQATHEDSTNSNQSQDFEEFEPGS